MNDYVSLLTTIMNYGKVVSPRGLEIKELMHVKLVIKSGCNVYSFPGVRPLDKILNYQFAELAWYLSGDRSSVYIKEKAKLWHKITNPDGTLNSNYGYLVFYHQTPHPSLGEVTMTPFDWALQSLVDDKDSRQAIMTYNNGGYNFTENHDYICTQHQAFFIRDNSLKCFIALRSSDSIYGLPYNFIWWSIVHQQLFLKLKVFYPELILGDIEVDIYSSHIYAKHYELVEQMLQTKHEKHFVKLVQPFPLGKTTEEYIGLIPNHIRVKPYELLK